jgi:hypothetical protein
MGSLIKQVKLSKKQLVVGETLRVDVQVSDPATDVMIDGVYGAGQYLQFRNPGSYTVVVTAALGDQVDQVGEKVDVSIQNPDVAKYPILWAGQDRYKARTVVFSIANADGDLSKVVEYSWNFGDGTYGTSRDGGLSHDYTDALVRDRLYTTFDVQVDAHYENGFVTTAKRTISVFNTYGFNKIRARVLTPRVAVQPPVTIPTFFFIPGEVICSFTVTNLEDEEISFTAEKQEWLNADPDDSSGNVAVTGKRLAGVARESVKLASATTVSSSAASRVQVGATAPAMDLRVPARSTITVVRVFTADAFTGGVFGVAIHLSGMGMCSKLPAISSAYIEVKLPMQWSGLVADPYASRWLGFLAKNSALAKDVVTHRDLSDYFHRASVSQILNPSAAPASLTSTIKPNQETRPPANSGVAATVKNVNLLEVTGPAFNAALANLTNPNLVPFDEPTPVVGQECDPDNVPDNLPDGMVCQLTSEMEWRYVPGRVLNAKKGDLILDPGGPGLVGQLLRQVTPPQFYSHCGIMSKNHIEIRHSTGSDDWLKDHPAGDFAGNKGTDGFDPAALKYLWPGTVTQTIDNAYYGEWMNSPDTGPYKISDFSFAPDLSNSSSIIYPLVVKPNPFDETAAIRKTLHGIADQAIAINGHYRFYAYTKPEIALGPEGVAGPDAGWAQGTLATVCSSFIWLAAQQANVKLEGPSKITSASDLEPTDTIAGAAVDGSTLDGLYLYPEAQRIAAGKWLYQTVYDIAHNKAGFWGTLFTDAPDDVANQLCNTFASDWAGDGSKDSDAWKSPGSANAVSPDNMMFWDSPSSGNQGNFRGVYGHREELFYLPGTYAQVPIYRWKLVPTKGTLKGSVTANADVTGANVSLLGSGQQDIVVGGDGNFEFDNVPSGDYTVTAGLNINGYWNSASVTVTINAGQTTNVTIALQPPPEIDRLVTISVDMETDWSSVWAHSPHVFSGSKSVRVQPFHSHEHIDLGGGDTPRGQIGFDIDLNADLSIKVSWNAQEVDDEVEGQINGGASVAKDGTLNWSGLVVVNDDPIDNDATTMSFTITNGQASA